MSVCISAKTVSRFNKLQSSMTAFVVVGNQKRNVVAASIDSRHLRLYQLDFAHDSISFVTERDRS